MAEVQQPATLLKRVKERERERESGRSAAACYATQASKKREREREREREAEVQQPATLLKRVKATCFSSYSGKRASASSVSARLFGKREKATAPRVHSAGLESFSWREPRAESARECVCVTVYVRGPTTTSAAETKGDRARDRAKLVPYFSPPLCRYRVISDIGRNQSVPRPD